MILRDNKRSVTGLRKQFLNIKGKLWIKAIYIDTKGRKVTKVSDASSTNLSRNIELRRSVFNALTKGIKLCVVENGFSSSTKVLKILNWGVKYGNNDVKVKRFSRRGKYYTGVWVKGVRGIQSQQRYKTVKKDTINSLAKENELIHDNKVWSDEY